MKLSLLQKFILIKSWENNKKTRLGREKINDFYNKSKTAPSLKIRIKIITRSIERLINKGLLVGYGEKTQYKLFIRQIKLTPPRTKDSPTIIGPTSSFSFYKN